MFYSLEGLGESTITMPAAASAVRGAPGMVDADGRIAKASGSFCGLVTDLRGEVAAVQIAGVVTLPYTGEAAPTPGYQMLEADGAGGVKVSSAGREYLVLAASSGTVTFIL